VLNTALYYNNKAVEEEPVVSDPCGQLDWLEARLNDTLATDDRVYIAAHVPPGAFERNPTTSNFFNTPLRYISNIEKRFLELVSRPRFAERIHAHFYGHVHTDSFRLFLDRATRQEARGVAFLGVSGTPFLFDK
jgi:sphingomyelin phosphodiesterase acid-like 3